MDLTCSLQESVNGEWNGDVDMGDGQLQLLRSEYLSRIESIPKLNEIASANRIQHLIVDLENDLDKVYECKLWCCSYR